MVYEFEHMFLVFKQHYTYFYTLFHSYIFSKKIKKYCLNTRTKQVIIELVDNGRGGGIKHTKRYIIIIFIIIGLLLEF